MAPGPEKAAPGPEKKKNHDQKLLFHDLWLPDKDCLKGALDKYNIISTNFFQKSWEFYTIGSVGMGNDCMLSFTL